MTNLERLRGLLTEWDGLKAPYEGPQSVSFDMLLAQRAMVLDQLIAAVREAVCSDEPPVKHHPAATAAGLENVPFLPVKPEILKAFAKQLVDYGVVYVKYGTNGVHVIPHEDVYGLDSSPNRTGDE